MDVELFSQVFVTVLVILDPVGNVPIFLSLTRDRPGGRSRAAVQATLVATVVILVFASFGQEILQLLGISIEALQVSGGLILGLTALELLGSTRGDGPVTAGRTNVAFVPLGTPLLAGPGAIAATMVYMRQAGGAAEVATVIAALLAALVLVFVALRFASLLAGVLGDNGIALLSQVVGLLLSAIAVQLAAEGIEQWVRDGVS